MSINSVSSIGGASCRTGASDHSVLDSDAPPGIGQQEWDSASQQERLELIQESIRMESGGLPSEATSAPGMPIPRTGSSAYSALYRDAPTGIAQADWDEAKLEQRQAMIEKSEQRVWVSQAISQIEESLQPGMLSLQQPSDIGPDRPFLRDLTGGFLTIEERSAPKITLVPQTYTVAPGDTLSKIAQRASITIDALRNANGLQPANDHRLQVGKELRLPPGARAIGSTQTGTTSIHLQDKAWQTALSYKQGNIAGLDDKHTRALIASTVETESRGGDLDIVNSAGYLGRYQAGASWLARAELIKNEDGAISKAMKAEGFTNEWDWGLSGGMTKFLKDEKNWDGDLNYEKYLASAEIQDKAFKTNSEKLYKTLVGKEHINAKTTQKEIAGLLKAGHIGGSGGALAVAQGGNGIADSNGTNPRKYYNDLVQRGDVYLKRSIATPAQPAPSPTEQTHGMEPSAPLVANKNTTETKSHLGNIGQ